MKPVQSTPFYGERRAWPCDALVHCEPLVERSRKHNWHIGAHSHENLIQFFLLGEGSGQASIDGQLFSVDANSLLVVPAGAVHGFTWNQGCSGYAVSLVLDGLPKLQPVNGRQLLGRAALLSTRESQVLLESVCEEIQRSSSAATGNGDYQDSLVKLLLSWVVRQAGETLHVPPASRSLRHYRKFLALLKQHEGQRRTLAEYASIVGISASHLNAICQAEAGCSALALVHQHELAHVQRLLAYTEYSITQVAARAGFADASYFTRFFKRQTGVTPRQFRMASGTVSAPAGDG